MTDRTGASWIVYALGALCAAAIAAAILVVGPASGSQGGQTRTATAAQGVVQSTVSGSGNLQPASQLNLGFKTSGTVAHIYVSQGEQVAQGQLLASLDPQSAEVSLEQAKANLQSAEANLAKEEETGGEGSSGSAAGNGASGATASARDEAPASDSAGASTASVQEAPAQILTAARDRSATPTGATAPTSSAAPSASRSPSRTMPKSISTSSAPGRSGVSQAPAGSGNQTTGARESETGETSPGSSPASVSSPSKPSTSPATREANLTSARAAVKSDKLAVQSGEQAVQDTKLYAPQDGVIVSLTGQVGEVVSASGTTKASATSGSSGGSGSGSGAGSAGGAAAALRSAGAAASTSGSGSTGASGSGGSAFAVLSDLSSLQLVAPLSESEIRNVKDGQIATVSVEALEGRKLAAHVSEVALLSTTNSGVVSYDVTFHLDQMEPGLRPGMSATAEVVVKQQEGVNVPTSAISGGAVTVIENGKHVRRRVVTGLAGNSSTIILSGLNPGEKVALPVAAASGASGLRGIGGRGGLGGGPGGGLGGGGLGGGAIFLRGG